MFGYLDDIIRLQREKQDLQNRLDEERHQRQLQSAASDRQTADLKSKLQMTQVRAPIMHIICVYV